jgi:hypothetical protein
MKSYCPGCEAKAEQIADLKRELSAFRASNRARLLGEQLHVSPTEADLLLRLYDARGVPIQARVLGDRLPTPENVKVWVSKLRRVVGIERRDGGYRLIPASVVTLQEILG